MYFKYNILNYKIWFFWYLRTILTRLNTMFAWSEFSMSQSQYSRDTVIHLVSGGYLHTFTDYLLVNVFFNFRLFIPDWRAQPVLWSHVHWKLWKLGCSRHPTLALLVMIMCLELQLMIVAVTEWHVRQSRRCSDDDITPWAALVAGTPAHKY